MRSHSLEGFREHVSGHLRESVCDSWLAVARGGPAGAGLTATAGDGAAREVCDAVPAQNAGQQTGDADQRHERREVGAVPRVVALDNGKDYPGQEDGACDEMTCSGAVHEGKLQQVRTQHAGQARIARVRPERV